MKKRGRKPKLSLEQADSVRWYYANTVMSMEDIARRFGISPTLVSRVIDRKEPYK